MQRHLLSIRSKREARGWLVHPHLRATAVSNDPSAPTTHILWVRLGRLLASEKLSGFKPARPPQDPSPQPSAANTSSSQRHKGQLCHRTALACLLAPTWAWKNGIASTPTRARAYETQLKNMVIQNGPAAQNRRPTASDQRITDEGTVLAFLRKGLHRGARPCR